MKKKIAGFILSVFLLGALPSSAAVLTDIPSAHWAYPEINALVESGLMTTNSRNEFRPNETITRTDFIAMLLRLCDVNTNPIFNTPTFRDVKNTTRNYEEILTSQQMSIIYGYPDNTFRPENPTKRSEANSAIANVINASETNTSILGNYLDKDKIPSWAIKSYVATASNNLIVSHPNPWMLEPNRNITRAEVAVTMARIYDYFKEVAARARAAAVAAGKKASSSMYDEDDDPNKIKEVFIQNETLGVYEHAPRNIVEIYNTKVVIGAGNVLIGSFMQDFNARKTNLGTPVRFVAKKDVSTTQGRLLYPAGTVFEGRVRSLQKSAWLEHQHKALVVLDKAILPDGKLCNLAAVALTKREKVMLTKGRDQRDDFFVNFKRNEQEMSKTQFLITFAKKVSPTIKYKYKAGEEVYILLTGDMILQYVDPSMIKKSTL